MAVFLAYNSYFNVQRIQRKVEVKLENDLTEEILKEESNIILTIVAVSEEDKLQGSTVLIISLPEEQCGTTCRYTIFSDNSLLTNCCSYDNHYTIPRFYNCL